MISTLRFHRRDESAIGDSSTTTDKFQDVKEAAKEAGKKPKCHDGTKEPTTATPPTSTTPSHGEEGGMDEHVQKWKVGDQCMSLYDGQWHSAKIEQISPDEKTCTVSYIGSGQKAILKLEDISALGSHLF
ncbi:hypothetical protein niasHS_008789 [Heterodera schachtii]|uniref:Tudor domain-containing protein n=1 Tax=Heterodera schachtii TaxID=97005 RepID=A0ABD2J7L1_HETSC